MRNTLSMDESSVMVESSSSFRGPVSDLNREAELFGDRLFAELAAKGTGVDPAQGSPSDADSREAYAAYGAAGFIGVHWPEHLGGRGLTALDTFAVEQALGYRWLPLSSYLLSVKTIGNALLSYARPELIERLVPEIAAGRLIFCQGFSEPEAGSDLASLRTTARRDGDNYVINGRKIWTSGVEHADWVYLAVRTDPDRPRHRGLSVLVADMSTPGIEFTVHRTLGGGTLGELTLDDVVVPATNLVGEPNGGWRVLMGTLDHERVTSEKIGIVHRLLDGLDDLAETPGERAELARLRGEAEIAYWHGWRATSLLAANEPASAASSMAKLSVALLMQRLASVALDLVGPAALIESGPGAVLEGRLAAFARSAPATTIAGGASDIQRRNIIRQTVSRPSS